MKIYILAILLVVVSAGPIPEAFVADGRNFGQPYYYTYPGAAYSPIGASYHQPQLVALPGDFLMEQQPATPFGAPTPYTDPLGTPQKIQLVLSVPADVPPGTSLSVTVNVNAQPSGATIVSVSNPVMSSAAPAPVAAAIKPPTDAVVVDANANKEPTAAGVLPDEFDLREPIMFLPPFENSKDSPILVQMQGEAQAQLAALLKTKSAL